MPADTGRGCFQSLTWEGQVSVDRRHRERPKVGPQATRQPVGKRREMPGREKPPKRKGRGTGEAMYAHRGKAPEKGRKEVQERRCRKDDAGKTMQERRCRKDGAGETVWERRCRKDDAGKTMQERRCRKYGAVHRGKAEPPIPGTRTTASPKNHDFSGKPRLAPLEKPAR